MHDIFIDKIQLIIPNLKRKSEQKFYVLSAFLRLLPKISLEKMEKHRTPNIQR